MILAKSVFGMTEDIWSAPGAAPEAARQVERRAVELTVARPWWRQRWTMILAGFVVAVGAGFIFAYAMQARVDWHGGLAWERQLILDIPRPLPASLDTLMMVIPWFGTNITLTPIVVGLAIWLWRVKRRRDLAMRLLIVQAGSYLLNFALKESFDRARPELVERRGWYSWSAYPSGHAIAGIAVLLTLAFILRRERGVTWPVVAALLIVTGNLYSRLYLGVHWPTDVIGGALVGAVWLTATSYAFRYRTREARLRRATDVE